ncbi:hypothetical protein ULMS_19110 [Patiriisocius marinistellae]|uniref:Methyltransferase type 12 domain-containing protein n=1 Tax=Patiriisocius marinistellae TaxID=2494560 RepID=A0A5J4FWM3_9FLAO|nr:methyltransferase [Patiriisocius marinistellae]GEQ86403.1 hypothetical protein ULMS_19110 [Patiriisocius marinistellae]
MITFSNTQRSKQSEIMDNFDLQGKEMETLLTDLKKVNSLLGGTNITIDGIKKLLKSHNISKPIIIADIGCGDGELLRKCANYLRKLDYNFSLIGIDANPFILKEAQKRSIDYPEISYQTLNIFSEEIKTLNIDISLCTLFLHHFSNEKITQILKLLNKQSKIGIVVNDLQRSKIAFKLFKAFSAIFIKTKIAKHDGLVSVARSFKKEELIELANNIHNQKSFIKWKWAFRYQWILYSNN